MEKEDLIKAIDVFDYTLLNMREIRKSLGLKLIDVEKVTGLSNAYLSQLECGKIKSVSFETAKKIVAFYENIKLPTNQIGDEFNNQKTNDVDRMIKNHLQLINKMSFDLAYKIQKHLEP